MRGGGQGRETGRKGGGRCTGGGRRGGRERDSQGGGKRKKKGKLRNIAKYFAIKKGKEAGANNYRARTGIKGYGKREVSTPLSPPPPITYASVLAALSSYYRKGILGGEQAGKHCQSFKADGAVSMIFPEFGVGHYVTPSY